MTKYTTLMAAMWGLIVAIVASAVSCIVGLAMGEKDLLVQALGGGASCFIIFFVAFLLLPLWKSSEERKNRNAKPSH